ncbi:MAG: FixH family protein [Aridibacter sp.]
MNRTIKIIALTTLFSLIALAAACSSGGSDMKKITEKKINDNLTVMLSGKDGKLKNGQQEIMLSFTDGSGNPVDIKAASLNFNMPAMGSMAEMNNAANLTTTGTKGQFKGKVNVEMAGDWTAQLSYEGAETGNTTISTKVQ